MAMCVEIQCAAAPEEVPPPDRFREWVGAIDCPSATSVCIRVVDEREMAELNERYCGKPGATNVLAFEVDPADSGQGLSGRLGDLCSGGVARGTPVWGRAGGAFRAHDGPRHVASSGTRP